MVFTNPASHKPTIECIRINITFSIHNADTIFSLISNSMQILIYIFPNFCIFQSQFGVLNHENIYYSKIFSFFLLTNLIFIIVKNICISDLFLIVGWCIILPASCLVGYYCNTDQPASHSSQPARPPEMAWNHNLPYYHGPHEPQPAQMQIYLLLWFMDHIEICT